MPRYNPAAIEPKWQEYWDKNHTFRAPEMPAEEKLYVLDMFPYPSGDGLHVGHPEGYTATDIVCRCARMQGKSVLHPMGFDAFGLPAEEHAIKTNTPPRESTEKNIANFRRQLKMLGFSYDWEREIATTDVDYFRWTQWILLLLFDTWYDHQANQGRPIAELPIPADVASAGEQAIAEYRDDHRLAYQAEALVNWCPALGTVLSNEEVQDGKSERGGHPVKRMPLKQWMLRITAYGSRLGDDLAPLDWPESLKLLQRNWIGRSTGAEVDFFIGGVSKFESWKSQRAASGFPRKPGDDVLRVYTTRPDTLFGATYMVLAPEHPFTARLTTDAQRERVESYCMQAAAKSDMERAKVSKEKTGVFTGSYAVNPVNGEQVPIWVADYVLATYGTGAIMAVPAHDTRDFEFAQQFNIPIIAVVDPGEADENIDRAAVLAGKQCSTCEGVAINSGQYDGLTTDEFKQKIAEVLAEAGQGKEAVNYKLRDWLFSRQRFWGEPYPLLHEVDENDQPTGRILPVALDDLPVDLPMLDDYKPHGRPEPPLEKAPHDWLFVEIEGRRYKRETNTMPQWAGSCWYYLRFIDPRNNATFVDPAKEKAWMPVDLYIGGAEHAVLHLLYARFWHKVLYDRGYVSTPEPFHKLVNQGMILGEAEFTGYCQDGAPVSAADVKRQEDGTWRRKSDSQAPDSQALVSSQTVNPDDVEKQGDVWVLRTDHNIQVDARAHKMSKSRGNVINPDEIVREYGADSLRLYEMFMGPLVATKPWNMAGVGGVRNFLDRVWRLMVDYRAETLALSDAITNAPPTDDQQRATHRMIEAVSNDVSSLDFNTAIARMMEFVNFFTKQETRPHEAMEKLVLCLSPFAPHIAEELWSLLGHEKTLAYEPWPVFDPAWVKDDVLEIPVQIKGKVRAKINVPADASRQQLEDAARANEKIAKLLAEKNVVKVIVVPGRLVNFVVK